MEVEDLHLFQEVLISIWFSAFNNFGEKKMINIKSKVEFTINLLILSEFVILTTFAVKQVFFSQTTQRLEPTIGKKVTLANDVLANTKSLILVLQTGCHFCNESLPFYKKLIDQSRGQVNFIAIFPQPVEEGKTHLEKNGIVGLKVIQTPIREMDVNGTPTLILTNSEGIIEKYWTGKLTPSQ